MKRVLSIAAMLVATSVGAASVDRGKISQIYADDLGHVAIKLDGGFPDAELNQECTTYNGWVGLHAPHENLVRQIYHAKEHNTNVTVVTDGCEEVTWLKLKSIYVNN